MGDKKLRLNTEWLSVCGGCHVAVVDLHEKILDVLKAVDILHCPVLTDIKDYPKADLGLITGAIRTEHDIYAARQMREACDKIISFGTCAVYGGVPGAAMVHTEDEILDAVYRNGPTTDSAEPPQVASVALEKEVVPLDEVIDVDLYLSGCPPHASFIFDGMLALLENRAPIARQETVCGRCTRRMEKTEVDRIRPNHEGIPEPDLCFLSQGYVCLGSVTLDRCLSPCPQQGVVCTGCAGPTMQILTEPNRDIRTDIAERMARLTAVGRGEVQREIERSAKTHYSYAMASKMISQKPTFQIHNWIAEVEG